MKYYYLFFSTLKISYWPNKCWCSIKVSSRAFTTLNRFYVCCTYRERRDEFFLYLMNISTGAGLLIRRKAQYKEFQAISI